jgi:hypothetical protein
MLEGKINWDYSDAFYMSLQSNGKLYKGPIGEYR